MIKPAPLGTHADECKNCDRIRFALEAERHAHRRDSEYLIGERDRLREALTEADERLAAIYDLAGWGGAWEALMILPRRGAGMADIGKPIREIEIEPLEEPLPFLIPLEEPVEEPAVPVREPEKVPA